MKILIFTDLVTNRLHYACTVIFKAILKVDFEVTNDSSLYQGYSGVRINYTGEADLPGVRIAPDGLLFEKGLHDITPDSGVWDELPTLFPSKLDANCPFDVFAATFYLSSRYEEHLPFIADSNGRFDAENSIAYKYGFLKRPIIDLWAYKLARHISSLEDGLTFPSRQYSFTTTLDVDSAYAYRHKGFMRTLGGIVKDVTSANVNNLAQRVKTILGILPDPYDTYDLLMDWHKELNVDAIFFFLLADYGMNDKNVPHTSAKYQSLIKRLADYNKVGIHPGYMSNEESDKLDVEILRLSQIILREVERSRQHFLMLRLPRTYRKLIAKGVREDYTMGFASHPGFRLGTCTPIPFYDIEYESVTKLMLYPFAVMDATLNMYMKLSPEEAVKVCEEMVAEVKAVDGNMITLWHNESVSEKWHWKGWSKVYRRMLEIGAVGGN
ncbi:MAG: hypothetical protein ACI84C_000789 [Flavobacteriales bacterium]|jgi:hypothetical protein